MTKRKPCGRITDKVRLDWLIEMGFMKFLGINGMMYGVRQAIDAAITASRKSGGL